MSATTVGECEQRVNDVTSTVFANRQSPGGLLTRLISKWGYLTGGAIGRGGVHLVGHRERYAVVHVRTHCT